VWDEGENQWEIGNTAGPLVCLLIRM